MRACPHNSNTSAFSSFVTCLPTARLSALTPWDFCLVLCNCCTSSNTDLKEKHSIYSNHHIYNSLLKEARKFVKRSNDFCTRDILCYAYYTFFKCGIVGRLKRCYKSTESPPFSNLYLY